MGQHNYDKFRLQLQDSLQTFATQAFNVALAKCIAFIFKKDHASSSQLKLKNPKIYKLSCACDTATKS